MAKSSKRKKSVAAKPVAAKGKAAKCAGVSAGRWIVLLEALCIVAAGFWVFGPALHTEWFTDDKFYLSENPLLNDPQHLWKIWFMPGSFIEYYPITQMVQAIQWQLWHMDSPGYVLSNIVLHVISALLIWRLLAKFDLRFAWLGGLLFAVHPMTVESVAWISELKNTLSLPPFLLAMCAWIDFEEKGKPRDYWLALGLFLVAMLCKITMSPFPVVILLYAWWKRGKIDLRDLKRSVPFFAVSMILGMTTMIAGERFGSQHTALAEQIPIGGFLSRLALAGLSGSFYFARFFWPWAPSPMYPQWKIDPPAPLQFLPWLILGGVIYFCWKQRLSWGRHVLFGLCFFFIFLAPFLGFNRISYMRYTWVMDHFLYIPMISLIGLAVAGLGCAVARMPEKLRPWSIIPAGSAMVLLALQSRSYAGIFSNQEALYAYTVQLYPGARAARENLGLALMQKGDMAGAIEQLQQLVTRYPDYAGSRFNLGTALMQANRLPEAADQFKEAVRIDPHYADAYDNLGATLLTMGQTEEAMQRFRQAIAITDYAQPHNDMGNALLGLGRVDEAIAEYRKAVALEPGVAQLHDNLASALAKARHIPEAIEQFKMAAQIDPGDDNARAGVEQLEGADKSGP